jgi:predicted transcriptional regulator
MTDIRRMKTADAVAAVLAERMFSKYRLAQSLGAAATSVNQWLSGTRMSSAYAGKFKEQYSIEVTDATKTAPNRLS